MHNRVAYIRLIKNASNKEVFTMNILKNWKKSAAMLTAAIMLTGSFTVPVMAHGHGSW